MQFLRALFVSQLALLSLTGFALADEKRIEIYSWRELTAYFEEIGYTPDTWRRGERWVPRIELSNMPERWRKVTVKEIDVKIKKRLFLRVTVPLILLANESVLNDRKRLSAFAENLGDAGSWTRKDRDWVRHLAQDYRLKWQDIETPDRVQVAVLLRRVDLVPASLAAAQMAEESGWGTSRFADLGNALFGQWSWTQGMKPLAQRSGMGDYRIAAFDKPVGSVAAYVRNLNTSAAYAGFRQERERLRKSGSKITGAALVHTLVNYSERKEAYIRSLKAIIRVNLLAGADDAYLAEGEHVIVVPVGEGAN